MKIGIFGGGPGAFALACHVIQAGHQAGLCEFERFAGNIQKIKDTRMIHSIGMIPGQYALRLVTTDPERLLEWADAIFVVTHAKAHDAVARLCADCRPLPLILCPGYVGGKIRFEQALKSLNPASGMTVAECSVLPFACRKPQGDQVRITGIKRTFLVSRPEPAAAQLMSGLFPTAVFVDHALAAGLNETNFIIHACIGLSNTERVAAGKPWRFYREGLSQAAGDLIGQVDEERLALMRQMNLEPVSLRDWFDAFYGDQGMAGSTVAEQLFTFPPFKDSPGPVSREHRYFTEDIPYGLACMGVLADKFHVPAPLTHQLTALGESFCHTDFKGPARLLDPIGKTG